MARILREPFFLHGRTSIVQRAVIMSLALGAMALVTAWITMTVYYVATSIVGRTYETENFVVPIVWCLAAPPLIYAPLNFWNRRSPLWTLAAVPASFAILLAFGNWMQYSATKWNHLTGLSIAMPAALALSGLLLVRLRAAWILAWIISCLGGALPIGIFLAADPGAQHTAFGVAPEIWAFVIATALTSSWLLALAIPWGLPFWWPPTGTVSTETAVQPEFNSDVAEQFL